MVVMPKGVVDSSLYFDFKPRYRAELVLANDRMGGGGGVVKVKGTSHK